MGVANRHRRRAIWVCLLAAACGDPTDPADLIPASIEVTPAAATLAAIGAEVQLTATVRNRKGEVMAGEDLVWASADATVASVGGTGLLTAIHDGNTIISAASRNGVVGKAAVAVAQLASEIRLSSTADTLHALEDTLWIAATVHDSRGNRIVDPEVNWSSSFRSVATVDSDGLVLSAGNGSTEITAASGPATASTTVTVAQRAAEIRLSREAATLAALDDTVRAAADVLDANGHPVANAGVTWSSSDETVATVDDAGLVTAVDNGRAKIVAASEPATAAFAVTVAQRAAEIRLSREAATLAALDDTVRVGAEVLDANQHPITLAEVTWTSGDESVVTVNRTGLVRAVGNGDTEVTAASGSAMRSATMTVAQVPAETRLSAAPEPLTALDDTVRLAAEAFDANGHPVAGAGFVWSSADESVATVDAAGLVTAVKNGSTEITAVSGPARGTVAVTVAQRPARMRLSPEPEPLPALDDTVRLVAEPLDANDHPVADARTAWSSDDLAVARVDRDGLVTAVGNGSTKIRAASGAARASVAVTVVQRVAAMRLSPERSTLAALEDAVRLGAEAFDGNGHRIAGAVFEWSSSDESVATVDAGGRVVAVGNGSATVSAVSGSVKRSVAVTVAQVAAEVRLSAPSGPLASLDQTVRLVAEALDANGHAIVAASFGWSVRDESVATVDGKGLVTAVGNGRTTVMAKSGPASATVAVTVEQRAAEIRLSPEPETLEALGDTLRIAANAFDANGHRVAGASITWSSDDLTVAMVNRTGLVTAVGNGSAEIMAASGMAAAAVTVTVAQRVAEMRMSPERGTLTALGDTVRLVAEAFDPNGHRIAGAAVGWSSGDRSVVTVDGAGLVVAVGNGTARVSAAAGTVTASVRVTVAQRAAMIAVSPASVSLTPNAAVRLDAGVFDANGHPIPDPAVTWSSDDTDVATVDRGGLVTAVGAGDTQVRAVSDGVEARVDVSVTAPRDRIRVSPDSAAFTALEDTVRLVAESVDENGDAVEEVDADWSSSDEAVATVNSDGLVTAVDNGSAEITATAGSATASAVIEVSQEADALLVSPESATLLKGEDVQLAADVVDANGYAIPGYVFSWSSDDDEVATVDSTGLVVSRAVGSVEIVAEAEGTDLSGVASVVVEAEGVDRIRVSPDSATLTALADTLRLVAESIDENGDAMEEVDASWSSSDEAVLTVDSDGLVTAVDNGSAEITATVGSATAIAVIEVSQEAEAIRVSPGDTTLTQGDSLQLTADVVDANGYPIPGFEFTWSSDDRTVATVSSSGLVVSRDDGSVEITAEAEDTDLSGVASIVVEAEGVDRIRVSPDSATLTALRDTLRLVAESIDEDGDAIEEVDASWSSSDEAVLTVDSDGLVTAVDNGSADITATAGSATASARIEVSQKADALLVSPDDTTLIQGETLQLTARVVDANGYPISGFDFTWSSDDRAVATVSSTGRVVSMEEGSVEITAEAGGTDVTGVANIVVEEVTEPRDILALLYERAGGPNWTKKDNWATDKPLGSWHGVKVDDEGHVTEVRLSNNGLGGTIPRALANLEHLEWLDLSINKLTGTIPPELGKLARLERLSLARNSLTGTIPPELGRLSRLEFLALTLNGLAGAIPPELANLAELKILMLSSNSLTGTIPSQLASLANLEFLSIGNNSLTGEIPPQLGNLRRLTDLYLDGNGLSGSIPAQLASLDSLTDLRLTNNRLAGSIPPQLGGLSGLRGLRLAGNSLTGSIPAELGNLPRLRALYLDGNDLTGSIPPELGSLDSLVNMKLSNNDLTGTIPGELGQMDTLLTLDLSFNKLTGTIPAGIGDLEHLVSLNLSRNDLSGAIPAELGDLSELTSLYLNSNELTGSIPAEIGEMANLRRLTLRYNKLAGAIPSELGDLAKLVYLELHHNELSGSLPEELGDLENLSLMKLNNNSGLTGAIPQAFIDIPLRSFYWNGTDLCSPDNDEFQDWLDGLTHNEGEGKCDS